MSKLTQLIEQITSKDFDSADQLFEQLMAEKVSAGIDAKTAIINEHVMEANPDLFVSPVDQKAAHDHAPVEADHSARTDEIEVPEPIEVDGHRETDPEEEEQIAMSEETLEILSTYTQTVLESHDFEADDDEQHQHPENVAKVPVGDPGINQASIGMKPSKASPQQVEEEDEELEEGLDHSGVICEMCGDVMLGEEEHVCEDVDLEESQFRGVRVRTMDEEDHDMEESMHDDDMEESMHDDDMEEELSPKQKKIDLNKNGKIDGSDLAKLRNEEEHEEGTDEPGKPEGDELEEGKGPDKAPRSRRSPYTFGDKAARTAGNVAGGVAGYGATKNLADKILPDNLAGDLAGEVAGVAGGVASGVIAGTAARQANRKLRGAKE